MSKTPFSNKVEILAELWQMYRNEVSEWANWEYFFTNVGFLTLPLCFASYHGLAHIEKDSSAKDMIDETFALLCDMIQVDRGGNYSDIEQMFSQSPLAPSAL
jgi:hypothetical protein